MIDKLEELCWWDYGPDVLAGLNLNDPREAVKHLEERIRKGFPRYEKERFIFAPKEKRIYESRGEERRCCTSCSLRQLFDDRPDTKPGFISIFPVGIRNAGKKDRNGL